MSATPVTPITPGFQIHKRKKSVPRWKQKLPFRRIFTYNVVCTLIAHTLLAAHLGTFNSLWFVFLSTPVNDPAHPDPPSYRRRLPFHFTGGLGMPPRDVGMAMAILGVIGIAMQLFIYPIANAKFGTVKSWRIFLFCFPLAYAFVPYLSIVPSKSPPPAEKDGIWVWLSLCTVLFIQVTGRTFALPATTILINNASPHPSVLGTMHGIGQSFSSAARTIGPTLGGSLYGLGLRKGVVGAIFWGLSGLALCNCIASYWVREGDGHEIWLEGDKEAEEEWQASQRSGRR
jgi:MFS family permease